jgi:hypothetical protein
MAALFAVTVGVGYADVTIDFNDPSTDGLGTYDMPSTTGTHNWSRQGIEFTRTFTAGDGWSTWDGLTYSSVNDTTTSGYLNQFAVYGDGMGVGDTGSYAVFYEPWTARTAIILPVATEVQGFQINNTTYAALAILNGDGQARAFTMASNDVFTLTISGFNSAGTLIDSVGYNLADYSQGSEDLVSDWEWVDLTELGTEVKSLEFSLSSTDNGTYGMNTPAYFAMDDFTVAAIPEPSSVILMIGGFGGIVWFRRRRNYFLQR